MAWIQAESSKHCKLVVVCSINIQTDLHNGDVSFQILEKDSLPVLLYRIKY